MRQVCVMVRISTRSSMESKASSMPAGACVTYAIISNGCLAGLLVSTTETNVHVLTQRRAAHLGIAQRRREVVVLP